MLAANRDERHERPTRGADWWADRPRVLGGRDLAAGGTWLAVDRLRPARGRDEHSRPASRDGPRSRGALVADFLTGSESAAQLRGACGARRSDYGAFNLLLLDGHELHYASNRAPPTRLGPGMHALGNAPLGTEWPKIRTSALAGCRTRSSTRSGAVGLCSPCSRERDDSAATSVTKQRSHFIDGADLRHAFSTVVLIGATGRLTFAERRSTRPDALTGEVRESFELDRRRLASTRRQRREPGADRADLFDGQTECAIGYTCQSTV